MQNQTLIVLVGNHLRRFVSRVDGLEERGHLQHINEYLRDRKTYSVFAL